MSKILIIIVRVLARSRWRQIVRLTAPERKVTLKSRLIDEASTRCDPTTQAQGQAQPPARLVQLKHFAGAVPLRLLGPAVEEVPTSPLLRKLDHPSLAEPGG